jgi:hypothetical protein
MSRFIGPDLRGYRDSEKSDPAAGGAERKFWLANQDSNFAALINSGCGRSSRANA